MSKHKKLQNQSKGRGAEKTGEAAPGQLGLLAEFARRNQVEILVVFNHHAGGLSPRLREILQDTETALIIPEMTGASAQDELDFNRYSTNGFGIRDLRRETVSSGAYLNDLMRTVSGGQKTIMFLDAPRTAAGHNPYEEDDLNKRQTTANFLNARTSQDSLDEILSGLFIAGSLDPFATDSEQREVDIIGRLKQREPDVIKALRKYKALGKSNKLRIVFIIGNTHELFSLKIEEAYGGKNIELPKPIKDQDDLAHGYSDMVIVRLQKHESLDLQNPDDRELVLRAFISTFINWITNPDIPESQRNGIINPLNLVRIDTRERAGKLFQLCEAITASLSINEMENLFTNRTEEPLAISLTRLIQERVIENDRRATDDPYVNLRKLYGELRAA